MGEKTIEMIIETKRKTATLTTNECGEPSWKLERISNIKILNVVFELIEEWEVCVGRVSETDKEYSELITNIKKDVEKLVKRGYEICAVQSLSLKED